MMLGMLLFWVLIVVGAVWLVRLLLGNRPASFAGHVLSPREIVQQRFARGEISKSEFDQMLTDLTQ